MRAQSRASRSEDPPLHPLATTLYVFHATARGVLREVGYDDTTIGGCAPDPKQT
jgi:hypothetical protein